MTIVRSFVLAGLALSLTACVVRTRPAGPRAAERRNDVHDARVEAMTGWD